MPDDLRSKKSPDKVHAFEKIVAAETGGVPTGKRKLVRLSVRNIARKTDIGRSTVWRMLRLRKFSLKSNVKRLTGPPSPDRDRQMRLIRRETTRYINRAQPVISVDAKKSELIGDFDNKGQKWEAAGTSEEVSAYNFPTEAKAKAVPYGIYDIAQNTGHVEVGTSSNTARFAVDSIRQWWFLFGMFIYAGATRLLILADSGGSNGCRPWMWKKMLQEFAEETGLTITVRHYPRGASKWNPIEHRLFAMISKSWSGYPLRSLSILLARIRGTTTETGLSVTARWNRRRYRTKEKVTKEEQKALRVRRHNVIQRWNYTIAPKRRNN